MKDERRKVYIHLNYYQDAASYRQRYDACQEPDKTPYGYHHLEAWGYHLTFSSSQKESKIVNLLRRAGNRFVGFDLWHAWRNRKRMGGVEAILTYSEKEHLAILLLRKLGIAPPSPLLIAQSVWLFSTWEQLPRWKQKLYRWLIQDDARTVLTVQSDENLKVARSLFPDMRSEWLRFGISVDSFPLKPPTPVYTQRTRPLRLLSLGNDKHRDWETLIEAVKGNKDVELRIATSQRLQSSIGDCNRILVKPARSLGEIHELYRWADVVVVPTRPNKHVSGITVILEGVANGKPIIATDTGGLKGYFGDDEIYYVPPQSTEALAVAVERIGEDEDTLSRAKNAQAKLLAAELTTKGLASRHVALLEDLLSS